MKTCIYRHFDRHGDLLYVGMSATPLRRTKNHESKQTWFTKVSRIEIEWFESRHYAALAEMRAIKTEEPTHNICGRYCIIRVINDQFKSFYDALDTPEQQALAKRAKTSVAYLWQLANGHGKAGASMSARLKSADVRITDPMLRPDLYGPEVRDVA